MRNKKSVVWIAMMVALVGMACGLPGAIAQTPTPVVPTPTAIPGWVIFEADEIEIWLPDSFSGGDLDEDLDLIVERMRTMGPEFEQIAQMIEQNPSLFVLFVFDANIGPSGVLTNMNITTERVLSGMTVDTYLDATISQFPSGFNVVEQESGAIEQYQSARLIIEADVNGALIKQAMYVIKDGGTVWVVTFSTGLDEFEQRFPTFELSMDTFRIQP